MAEIANLPTVRIRRRRVLDGLIHEDQRAGRRYARGNRGILPTVAWFSGVSRRMVAMIAAGELLVIVVLGYLLLRAQAGHGQAANHRLESDEQAYEKWVNRFSTRLGNRPAVVILEPDALPQRNSSADNAQPQARLPTLSPSVNAPHTTNS